MQQVIQVSLSGHPAMFRLEMDAFDTLRHYLDRARERLSEDPDLEEVLNDLEQSIGEKLAVRLLSIESVITQAEVEAVLALINRVKAKGVGVVLITHRLQDLFRVCDRIAVMYEGTKVAERKIEDTDLQDLVDLIVGKGAA